MYYYYYYYYFNTNLLTGIPMLVLYFTTFQVALTAQFIP